MAKRKWTESAALNWLRNNSTIINKKNIQILYKYNSLTTLSAADYLKNVHGYRLISYAV